MFPGKTSREMKMWDLKGDQEKQEYGIKQNPPEGNIGSMPLEELWSQSVPHPRVVQSGPGDWGIHTPKLIGIWLSFGLWHKCPETCSFSCVVEAYFGSLMAILQGDIQSTVGSESTLGACAQEMARGSEGLGVLRVLAIL